MPDLRVPGATGATAAGRGARFRIRRAVPGSSRKSTDGIHRLSQDVVTIPGRLGLYSSNCTARGGRRGGMVPGRQAIAKVANRAFLVFFALYTAGSIIW